MSEPLLEIRDLRVWFSAESGKPTVEVLRGIDLSVAAGESVALVGPSGCGKSITSRAVCGLLPGGAMCSGRFSWDGRPYPDSQGAEWGLLRGSGMTLVLQEPKNSLNPVLRIGDQIAETIRFHDSGTMGQARQRARDLLEEVQVPDPAGKARAYPHELSGGMQQRVLLAAALACNPRLLICDEPTTALDPTVQKEILILVDRLRRSRGMALLFITHDHDLVPLMADRIVAMQEGRIVSQDQTPIPALVSRTRITDSAPPVLVGRGLGYDYAVGKNFPEGRAAVIDVNLDLYPGRALGLAGESGCGKTTLARMLSMHLRPRTGGLVLNGTELSAPGTQPSPDLRRSVQMIFQEPGQSLNPRQRVGTALEEAAGKNPAVRPDELLREVDLPVTLKDRFPHELSGGQKQRVALARSLACEPQVLIADEITSALDIWTRNRVLAMLDRILVERRLALLLIDHNLDTLHSFCDRVMVMYRGYVLEIYKPGEGAGPRHPYTLNLLAASPSELGRDPQGWRTGQESRLVSENLNSGGCPWAHSCPMRNDKCDSMLPILQSCGEGCCLRCPEA